MKVRCTIPISIYLIGETEASLSVSTSFEFRNLNVSVHITPTTTHEIKLKDEKAQYCSRSNGIDLEFEEPSGVSFLTDMIKAGDREGLADFLSKIANRVVLAIRNFGAVPHIREFHPGATGDDALLMGWKVKFTEGDAWHSLPSSTGGLLAGFASLTDNAEPYREMNVWKWPDIAEAIADEIEPAPEQEFYANCIEHVQERNFRLALVESVICLEIVLSQFLRIHLRLQKGMPRERVEKFLSPNCGLTARLAGLLELTLDTETLGKIEIGSVLTAVSWRNKITHETGHLPAGVDETALRKHISAVLVLSWYLARRRDEIAAEPDLKIVAESLAQELEVPPPTIRRLSRHVMWVEYFFSNGAPSEERMSEVADKTGQALGRRDNRFVSETHLYVRFMGFPWHPQWSWSKGQLVQTSAGRQPEEFLAG